MSASRPEGPRLFTIEEANAMIPRLEVALSEMAAYRAELKTLRKDIEVLSLIAASASGTDNPDAAELKSKRRRYRAVAAEIELTGTALTDSGCLVKHPDEGLVDFFHLRDDRLVFLCWKVGEKQIEHWHPLSGGYATRKALGSSDA
ncbi:MAG: DUF2203 domain-containing protein [Candidatus Eisenbacteria bacterium]|nr:DUF2203 domain-containing protein [Candidatus Eisenbacteria bacterium]